MMMPTTILLIATAAMATLSGLCVLLAVIQDQRQWALAIARLGLVGGAVCAGILAVLIGGETGSNAPVVQVPLWTWFSFSAGQTPSVTFGLEATSIKACLISLTGGLAFIGLWNADSQTKGTFSNNAILATSLLYAAGTVLIFAPNTVQALLGWGAVSLTAGALIRLSPQQSSANGRDDGVATSGKLIRVLQFLGNAAASLERIYIEYIWKSITRRFANWFGEQAEFLESSSITYQLLATVLGTSAILLTWLCGI